MTLSPKMLTFDVFGTVVDWHTSLTREGEQLAISSAASPAASLNFLAIPCERRPDGSSPPAPLIPWLHRGIAANE